MTETNRSKAHQLWLRLETLVHDMLDCEIDMTYARHSLEKAYISEVLRRNGGNIGRSARALGMHRNTLTKRIRDLKIS